MTWTRDSFSEIPEQGPPGTQSVPREKTLSTRCAVARHRRGQKNLPEAKLKPPNSDTTHLLLIFTQRSDLQSYKVKANSTEKEK